MTSHIRLAAVCLLATGCAGTRLYERAEEAAAAGRMDQAVAYDERTAQDGRSLPEGFADTYRAHTAAFIDQRFAALGPPSESNADAQDAVARGLLLWARGQQQEELVRQKMGERLGQLAQLRWPRVQQLVTEDRLDDATALARSLLEDASGVEPLATEAKQLEARARTRHLEAMKQVDGQLSAKALHARLAEQMGASPDAEMQEADAALVRRTGMKLTVQTEGGAECEAAVRLLSPYLPPPGDTDAHFTFHFTQCKQDFADDHHTAYRTRTVTEIVEEPVVDTVSTEKCDQVQTGSATICDSSESVTRMGITTEYRKCHEEGTYGQRCHTELSSVARTERVRRSHEVQETYEVYRKRATLAWAAEVTVETGGHHLALTTQGSAQSSVHEHEGSSPSDAEPVREATEQLARQLASTTSTLSRFAVADRAAALEAQAAEAKAKGEANVAQALWTELGVLRLAAPAPLVEQLAPQHVPADMLTAAVRHASWSWARGLPTDVGLPAIPEAEILEDAHEITDSVALSAQSRSRYQGALMLGLEQFRNTGPDPLQARAFSIGAFGGGASPTPVPFTCLGGTMHLLGTFGSRGPSLDTGVALGAGLKALGLCVMPVAGLIAGTSSHSDPESPEFRENAAQRPAGIDAAWGSQVTLALPYPLNATLNARVLRTSPLLVATGNKQWTSRAEAVLGWRFMPELEFMVFGRYWQTAQNTAPKALDFFKGDGKQRQTVVLGLGIGGGYDRPPWETSNP